MVFTLDTAGWRFLGQWNPTRHAREALPLPRRILCLQLFGGTGRQRGLARKRVQPRRRHHQMWRSPSARLLSGEREGGAGHDASPRRSTAAPSLHRQERRRSVRKSHLNESGLMTKGCVSGAISSQMSVHHQLDVTSVHKTVSSVTFCHPLGFGGYLAVASVPPPNLELTQCRSAENERLTGATVPGPRTLWQKTHASNRGSDRLWRKSFRATTLREHPISSGNSAKPSTTVRHIPRV